jgi:hypothetical protein
MKATTVSRQSWLFSLYPTINPTNMLVSEEFLHVSVRYNERAISAA